MGLALGFSIDSIATALSIALIESKWRMDPDCMGLEGTNHIKLDISDKPYFAKPYYEDNYIFPNLYYETFKKIPEV